MSNIPISSLPIAIALTGSEAVPLVQGGTTKQVPTSLLWSSNPANLPAGGLLGQALVKATNSNYDTKWATVGGLGTVQEVDTGTGLTGGPITLTGTISLASISSHTILANATGGSAAPIPNTTSAVLDFVGSTQGDILYRDASGWAVLAPGASGQILTSQGAAANPKWSAVGSGTVTSVGLSLPAIFSVSGSPVTTSGTLTGTLATQSANLVWAGPSTGAASAPTFRALVGADLPNPSATTLGGIQSTTGASHQWISSISTSGVPGLSQPAFTDISGTVAASQLPTPTTSSLGGVQAINAVASNWIRSINTSGVPQLSQPAFSDLSGSVAVAQLPPIGNNTVLANVSGGTTQPSPTSPSAVLDIIGATQGDVLYRGASGWAVLAPGTNGQVLQSGGAAANPSWATVTGTGTVTSVATNNGVTGGTITTTGTIGLASIATGNVLAYTGAGSGTPTATTPSAVLDVIGSTQGSVLYRGGSNWTALAPGTNGQFLQTTGAGSTPQWAGAVNSIAGQTGALTLSDGLSNNSTALYALMPGAYINKFRNPGMDVAQRGSGAITVSTSGAYTLDGWIVLPTGASVTAQQVANNRTGALSANALQVTGNTSVTDVIVKQRIEGVVAAPLAGAVIVFTAQVFNNTGGSITPTLTVKHANALDNWAAATTDVSAQSLQACANSAWTQVSYSFTASSSSGNGLEFAVDFGNNFSTNAKSIKISECDVRIGSQIHTPEIRQIQAELGFCQRYYWRRNAARVGDIIGSGHAISASGVIIFGGNFHTTMRVTPTTSFSAVSHLSATQSNGAPVALSGGTWDELSPDGYGSQSTGFTGASGLSAGNGSLLVFNNSSGWFDFSAEL